MTDQLRDKARTLGLDRLTDEHLEQFERATAGMERHPGKINLVRIRLHQHREMEG